MNMNGEEEEEEECESKDRIRDSVRCSEIIPFPVSRRALIRDKYRFRGGQGVINGVNSVKPGAKRRGREEGGGRKREKMKRGKRVGGIRGSRVWLYVRDAWLGCEIGHEMYVTAWIGPRKLTDCHADLLPRENPSPLLILCNSENYAVEFEKYIRGGINEREDDLRRNLRRIQGSWFEEEISEEKDLECKNEKVVVKGMIVETLKSN